MTNAQLEGLKETLVPPYFYEPDGLPGLDFNREFVQPGEQAGFPDGVIGIRVDDDFWCVAAIPLSYADVPLIDIVRILWPDYAADAQVCPDHGTMEQQVYQAEQWAKSQEAKLRHLNKALREAQDEIDRLRPERPILRRGLMSRKKASDSYFVRQYEQLLTATAHEFVKGDDPKTAAICVACGLLHSHRVHSKHWLQKRAEGVDPHFRLAMEFPDADE
jgi:hypothetical protein